VVRRGTTGHESQVCNPGTVSQVRGAGRGEHLGGVHLKNCVAVVKLPPEKTWSVQLSTTAVGGILLLSVLVPSSKGR